VKKKMTDKKITLEDISLFERVDISSGDGLYSTKNIKVENSFAAYLFREVAGMRQEYGLEPADWLGPEFYNLSNKNQEIKGINPIYINEADSKERTSQFVEMNYHFVSKDGARVVFRGRIEGIESINKVFQNDRDDLEGKFTDDFMAYVEKDGAGFYVLSGAYANNENLSFLRPGEEVKLDSEKGIYVIPVKKGSGCVVPFLGKKNPGYNSMSTELGRVSGQYKRYNGEPVDISRTNNVVFFETLTRTLFGAPK